jgi:hypothetical protein
LYVIAETVYENQQIEVKSDMMTGKGQDSTDEEGNDTGYCG